MLHLIPHLAFSVLIAILVSGCIPHPGYREANSIENQVNELLHKSASRAEVVQKLGMEMKYREETISYIGCNFPGGVLFFLPLPPPAFLVNGDILIGDTHCYELLLEFDKKNQLKAYTKIPLEGLPQWDWEKERMIVRELAMKGDPIAKEALTKNGSLQGTLVFGTNEIMLRKLAKDGDMNAMLQVYWADIHDEEALKWLCRAADRGNSEAQYRVGLLYEHGSEGVPKDLVKSYVWYRLSYASGNDMSAGEEAKRILESLSAGQAMLAEQLFRTRQPDQCERDLLPLVTD